MAPSTRLDAISDTAAEQHVLSAAMLSVEVADALVCALTPNDFFSDKNIQIFDALMYLHGRGEGIDNISIGRVLRDRGLLDAIGGSAMLTRLLDVAANLRVETAIEHARIIKGRSRLRSLLAAVRRVASQIETGVEDVPAFLAGAEQSISDAVRGDDRGGLVAIGELVQAQYVALQASLKSSSPPGLLTGFRDWDAHQGGLFPSDSTIIAARPGMGKTSLALAVAINVALRGKGVAFFSLEMGDAQLAMRALFSESLVNVAKARSGGLDAAEWSRLVGGTARLSGLKNLLVYDRPGLTTSELRARLRRARSDLSRAGTPLSLVVIDYLQLMRGNARKGGNREEEVSMISREIKGLAKEFGVAIITLAQLNRAVETRQDKRPLLSDLRESGAIEQDADRVIFLYRDAYYNVNVNDKRKIELIVGKDRHGPVGTIEMNFDSEFVRFSDAA